MDLGGRPIVPQHVGDWKVLGRLGQGATAQVFRVERAGTQGALKWLRHVDPTALARAEREARALARLEHPNVVRLLDVVRLTGRLGLILEPVEGPTLDQVANAQVEAVYLALLDGVEAVHAAGLVHRDIKPANVLLTADGQPKLADFGLAIAGDDAARLTATGAVVGTPAFMAPEQVQAPSAVDGRADVFALGGVLFQLVTGRPPFRGQHVFEVLHRAASGWYPDPATLVPDLPVRVCEAIHGALSPDPSERIPDVATLRSVFEGSSRWSVVRHGASATVDRVLEERAAEPAAVSAIAVEIRFTGQEQMYGEHADVAERAVSCARDAVADVGRRHGAVVVASEFEGQCTVFDHPDAAMRFAIAVQQELMYAPWPNALLQQAGTAPEYVGETLIWRGLRAKVGLAEGTVRDATAMARRVAEAAHGGQVLVEGSVTEQPTRAEALGAAWVPVRARDVGLPDSWSLRQLTPLSLAAREFPSRAGGAVPTPRGTFVGRDVERGEVVSRLSGPGLVTITGPAGIGKTRLAIEAAQALPEGRPVWFCALEAVTTVDALVAGVAQGLGLSLPGLDAEAALRAIGAALAGRREGVVVLDNLEQLGDQATAALGVWADAAPSITFLVSSRRPVGVPGEVVVRLDPLSAGAGMALFEERAPTDSVAHESAAVRAIVSQLDGIPLAIELAAAQLGAMSAELLHKRLSASVDARFSVLQDPSASTERQATLEAALDGSWALLTESERSVLAQCAVFPSGFDLPAAEQVVEGVSGLGEILVSLVEQSLLRRRRTENGRVRFEWLVSIRAYALRTLSGTAQRACLRRHARQVAELGTLDALDALNAHGGGVRFRRLVADRPHLEQAVQTALDEGDAATAVPVVLALAELCRRKGPMSLALRWIEPVLALPDLVPAWRSRLLWARGTLHTATGDPAKPDLREAVAMAQAAENVQLEGRAHVALGRLATQQGGRTEEARTHFRDALRCARQAGHALDEAVALRCIASATLDRSEAHELFYRALSAQEAVGDAMGAGLVQGNLGSLYAAGGDLDLAARHYQESIAQLRGMEAERPLAAFSSALAGVWTMLGDYEGARGLLEQALERSAAYGDRRSAATTRMRLGVVALAQDDLDVAQALLWRAKVELEALQDHPNLATTLVALGQVARRRERWSDASSHVTSGIERYASIPLVRGVSHGTQELARLHLARGEGSQAADAAERAIDLAREVQDRVLLCSGLVVRGMVALTGGRREQARRDAADAEDHLPSGLLPQARLRVDLSSLQEALGHDAH